MVVKESLFNEQSKPAWFENFCGIVIAWKSKMMSMWHSQYLLVRESLTSNMLFI